MTAEEKKKILENVDEVMKHLTTAEDNTRAGLETALKLNPNYEHRAAHENALQQVQARREEMLKQRKQIEEIQTEG